METAQSVKVAIFNDFRLATTIQEATSDVQRLAKEILALAHALEIEPFPLTEVIQQDFSRIKGWKTFLSLIGTPDLDFESRDAFWQNLETNRSKLEEHFTLLRGLTAKSPEVVRNHVEYLNAKLSDMQTTSEEIFQIYVITETLGVSDWLDDWYDYTNSEFFFWELVASHPNCPGWIIDENIADSNLEWLYAKIATNPNLSEGQLAQMIEGLYFAYSPDQRDPDLSYDEFEEALRSHPSLTPSLEKLFLKLAGKSLKA